MAKKFEGNFECVGENTEKYITLSVPIKKEHDNGKTTIHKLKAIDSYRFMQNSLLSLVDSLSEIYIKEPKDSMRSMIDSLLQSVDKISEINKKNSTN